MSVRTTDLILTAAAPATWGTTYFVTTQMLPPGLPITVGMLRALPAGLLLLLCVRQLPPREWLARIIVLGGLNFALFWAALFFAAYKLPGGVAATLGATTPLLVLILSRLILNSPLRLLGIVAASAGLCGVGLLILGPGAKFDALGVAAALLGAVSFAAGTVLTRRWQPPVSPLVFTAWQLTAGGILLLPAAILLEPRFPPPTLLNVTGLLWLGLVGAALTYFLWFRGIARLGPESATVFGFLSPLTAVLIGWVALGQTLGPSQMLGVAVVLFSVWLGQIARRPLKPADELVPYE